MSGLRTAHSVRHCCGLLLTLLLALGPVAQSVAAAQGPCGQAPVSDASPAAVETIAGASTGAQWTCPDQESVSVIRALPSDRLDGPSSSGGGTSLDDKKRSRHAPSQRTGPAPVCPAISPVLVTLRPVVLLI